jgi:hypothetical protein
MKEIESSINKSTILFTIKNKIMGTNIKFHIATVAIIGIMFTATITSPLTSVFGRHYNEIRDFVCCQKNQLVIHHYYTVNVFWITVADGYTEEITGKVQTTG